MFGLTAQTGYVLALSEHWYGLFAGAYVIAGFGVLAALCWIWLGVALRRIYLMHYRLINMFMALALLECLYSILKG